MHNKVDDHVNELRKTYFGCKKLDILYESLAAISLRLEKKKVLAKVKTQLSLYARWTKFGDN